MPSTGWALKPSECMAMIHPALQSPLLVGAIRTAAETNTDPATILSALNRRLLGRGDAPATFLALRIARDGSAMLANASHLPP